MSGERLTEKEQASPQETQAAPPNAAKFTARPIPGSGLAELRPQVTQAQVMDVTRVLQEMAPGQSPPPRATVPQPVPSSHLAILSAITPTTWLRTCKRRRRRRPPCQEGTVLHLRLRPACMHARRQVPRRRNADKGHHRGRGMIQRLLPQRRGRDDRPHGRRRRGKVRCDRMMVWASAAPRFAPGDPLRKSISETGMDIRVVATDHDH